MRSPLLLLLSLLVRACVCYGAEPLPQVPRPDHRVPWTLETAARFAKIHDDPFVAYVATQLAAQHGEAEKNRLLRSLLSPSNEFPGSTDRAGPNLISLFGGATAIRESLQLDQMLGQDLQRSDFDRFWNYSWNINQVDFEEIRFAGDGGLAVKATLQHPRDLTIAPNGDLLISEFAPGHIRRIDQSGEISTAHRRRGPGHALSNNGLFVDKAGNVFFADTANSQIVKIDVNGQVEIVKQGGWLWRYPTSESDEWSADVAEELQTNYGDSSALAVDDNGAIYFVRTMGRMHRIFRRDPEGDVSVFAKIPSRKWSERDEVYSAPDTDLNNFYHPTSITGDDLGNLYFAESDSSCVKKLDADGTISIVAGQPDLIDTWDLSGLEPLGGDGGPAVEAALIRPSGLIVDERGVLYISDAIDQCVRMIDLDGRIHTVAGTTARGFSGDGGPAVTARLNVPRGLAIDADGNLYVADEFNHRVRKIDSKGIISTIAGASEPWEPRVFQFEEAIVAEAADAETGFVDLASIEGPDVESHPFTEMLNGRVPRVSVLADYVPSSFYYMRFESLGGLFEIVDYSGQVSSHLRSQSLSQAFSSTRRAFVQKQIALPDHRSVYSSLDATLDEIAVTGSDLYWELGSDVSILFSWRDAERGRQELRVSTDEMLSGYADFIRKPGSYRGTEFNEVVTSLGGVHFYEANLSPQITARSNSLFALQRLIDTSPQVAPKSTTRLSQSKDLLYMRHLLPLDAPNEDGLVFFSDAFIRRQVGPEVRIKQHRRLRCLGALRTIEFAALMHRTQTGKIAADLADLVASGSLEAENLEHFACPDGGKHGLQKDGLTATCSFHGSTHWMRPCGETELRAITIQERDAYQNFVDRYSRYWDTYFDPIGIRIGLSDQSYRVETVILPLIRNSYYEGLLRMVSSDTLRSQPPQLDRGTLIGISLKVNKFGLTELMMAPNSWDDDIGENAPPTKMPTQAEISAEIDRRFARLLRKIGIESVGNKQIGIGGFLFEGVGDEIGFFLCDSLPNFRFNMSQQIGSTMSEDGLASMGIGLVASSFSAPVVAVISVEDKAIVDQFLEDADPLIGQLAQQRPSGFLPVDYQYSRFQIDGQQIRSFSFNAFGVGLRGYLVRLGDNLYITSQLELIRDLIAMKSKEGGTPKSIRPSQAGQVHGWMWPINYDESRESYQFEWAAANQKACIKNLPSISGVLRAGIATSMDQVVGQAALRDGATYACPSGGRYSVEQGQFGPHAVCDLHGHLLDPKQPIAPARQSETGKLLAELKSVSVAANLSPEGLRAVISVQRSKKTPSAAQQPGNSSDRPLRRSR